MIFMITYEQNDDTKSDIIWSLKLLDIGWCRKMGLQKPICQLNQSDDLPSVPTQIIPTSTEFEIAKA